jgi:hypothetical protein
MSWWRKLFGSSQSAEIDPGKVAAANTALGDQADANGKAQWSSPWGASAAVPSGSSVPSVASPAAAKKAAQKKADEDFKQAEQRVAEISELRWVDLAAARGQLAALETFAKARDNYRIQRLVDQAAKLVRHRDVKRAHGLLGGSSKPVHFRMVDATTLTGYGGQPIIDASDCIQLQELPAGLRVAYLNLTGCTSLRALPEDLSVRYGRLTLRGCSLLTKLPIGLGPLHELDLAGCLNITALPDDLMVTGWIDVAGSGLKQLPERLSAIDIHWNGVPVDERIAFRPDQLTTGEIMEEPNTERRRVMMERFGFDTFMAEAQAVVLDVDTDLGGPRRLLRVDVPDDEPLVCVSVICPSTQRQFMLRVPPHITTCRQAIAWTAGFDDPGKYQPRVET